MWQTCEYIPFKEESSKLEIFCVILIIATVISFITCIAKTNRELVKYSLENGEIKREVIATNLGSNCEVLRTKLKDEKNIFCEQVKE